MSEQTAEITTEATVTGTAEITPDPTPEVEVDTDASGEPESFSRDYVEKLRNEASSARVRAKRTDDANARLVAAYAAADGRLVDVDALAYDESLLDDEGLVDRDKVTAAVDAAVAAKPYLRKSTSLPMGVRPDAPTEPPGLFTLARRAI